jgi:hypothetical protein
MVAIASIAERYGERFSEQLGFYCARLWSKFLIEGLRWRVQPARIYAHRPEKFRAPTWSWACVDGTIFSKTPNRDQLLAEDLSYMITVPATQGRPYEYGLVGPSFLLLVGPIIKVAIAEEQTNKMPSRIGYDLYIFNPDEVEHESECIGVGNLNPGPVPEDINLHLYCFGLVKANEGTEKNSAFCDGILLGTCLGINY